jgi:hypothetical protein
MKTLLAKLLGLTRAILDFYAPILRELLASGMAALLPIALEIVVSLANKNMSGAEKREAALEKLRSAALREGIAATESLLRLTVESAVTKLKTERTFQ